MTVCALAEPDILVQAKKLTIFKHIANMVDSSIEGKDGRCLGNSFDPV